MEIELIREKWQVKLLRPKGIEKLGLPAETYILQAEPLEAILFNRELLGVPLKRATLYSTKAFLRMIEPELLKYNLQDISTLTILSGGVFYQIPEAFFSLFDQPLNQNFIGIKRIPVAGEIDHQGIQKFDFQLTYSSFEAPAKIAIIGDTIATGGSAVMALEKYLAWGKENGLEKILFFSICGNRIGGQAIYDCCLRHQVDLMLVFGLGLLDLGKDGTALQWNSKEVITIPDYLKRGKEIYSEGECAIGDWGLRNTNIRAYLAEREKEKNKLKA